MTTQYQYLLVDFSLAEVNRIWGPRVGPYLVGPEPDPSRRLSLHEAMGIAVCNEAVDVGISRLEPKLLGCAIRSAIWYALWQYAVCDEDGQPIKETPEETHSDVVSRIAGVTPSARQRFILTARGREPETVSSSSFLGDMDEAIWPPTMKGLRLVDLAAIGGEFAIAAGRPLVKVRRVAPSPLRRDRWEVLSCPTP